MDRMWVNVLFSLLIVLLATFPSIESHIYKVTFRQIKNPLDKCVIIPRQNLSLIAFTFDHQRGIIRKQKHSLWRLLFYSSARRARHSPKGLAKLRAYKLPWRICVLSDSISVRPGWDEGHKNCHISKKRELKRDTCYKIFHFYKSQSLISPLLAAPPIPAEMPSFSHTPIRVHTKQHVPLLCPPSHFHLNSQPVAPRVNWVLTGLSLWSHFEWVWHSFLGGP